MARPNPREKWEIIEVPQLRIVDEDLWNRVKARQGEVRIEMGRDAAGNALNRAHRRLHLLSGLLVCGCCGGPYIIVTTDRYGCATRRSKGTCFNKLVIEKAQVEARVLVGLKERLMAPELVAVYVEEFKAEIRRTSQAAEIERANLTRRTGEFDRKIAGIMRAIEDGNYNPTLTARLSALEAERAAVEARLSACPPRPKLLLHPNIAALYRQQVERLEDALRELETRATAAQAIRTLIDRIVLTPNG